MLLNHPDQLPLDRFLCSGRPWVRRQTTCYVASHRDQSAWTNGCLEDHHIETCVFMCFFTDSTLVNHYLFTQHLGNLFLCFPTTITSKYRCLASRYAPWSWWSVGPLTLVFQNPPTSTTLSGGVSLNPVMGFRLGRCERVQTLTLIDPHKIWLED